jgi:hypothetical protein
MAALKAQMEDGSWAEEDEKPLSDEELEGPGFPTINWYEQDLRRGTPRRLVRRTATAEDRKRDRDLLLMIEESYRNPDYDDAHLNRQLVDTLIQNPNFADLTEQLKEIKADIKTREEQAAIDAEENKELDAGWVAATRQVFVDMLNDPAAAVAKNELQEVLDKMPEDKDELQDALGRVSENEDINGTEFHNVLLKAFTKLENDPTMQEKIAGVRASGKYDELEKEWQQIEQEIDGVLNDEDEVSELDLDDPEVLQRETDELMQAMRDVLKSMGGDSDVQAELDALIAEDPMANQDGVFEREMDMEELTQELIKLAEKTPRPKDLESDEEEEVPAELQSKVDKIMADPKLMEKLAYIQQIMQEAKSSQSDITHIAHEVAPDPYELEDDRTATLGQRMRMARKDPEHRAALDRLRVALPPPFGISPALKSFNQAIQFAYIGANDDIRRILWRSYQKARSLPTFLQNIGDDAWDILYYSQAVTWGSNQNRQDHLRTLLADLKKLGRDGPPTHPSSLVKDGDGE